MNSELLPIDIAKREAWALADELLARKGYKLSHSKCLEATAIACGFTGWNAMSARCKASVPITAVIVKEKRADMLARHLMERRGLEVSPFECAEILRRIESMVAEHLADLLSTSESLKAQQGLRLSEDK